MFLICMSHSRSDFSSGPCSLQPLSRSRPPNVYAAAQVHSVLSECLCCLASRTHRQVYAEVVEPRDQIGTTYHGTIYICIRPFTQIDPQGQRQLSYNSQMALVKEPPSTVDGIGAYVFAMASLWQRQPGCPRSRTQPDILTIPVLCALVWALLRATHLVGS